MKNHLRMVALMAATCMNLACDGPHEEAGEKADATSGATGGESSIIAGPAEKAGERKDREEAQREADAGSASR